MNGLAHVLRAHQLCMEGYASLFDRHLSTVWSAPNYCYRCGNQASILEVGPGQSMFFNVFDAAPENERDGPTQNAQQNAAGKVCLLVRIATPETLRVRSRFTHGQELTSNYFVFAFSFRSTSCNRRIS
jgi:hypothetical protein